LKTIFVVDDNNVNLKTAANVLSKHYRLYPLSSASGMFELLENIRPDIILLDILMPEMDGFDALKLLKSNSRFADIPVIFLTSKDDTVTESLGFQMGVVDFISKPFSEPVLLNRIKSHLDIESIICERMDRVKRLKNGIVFVLADIVENRDVMTDKHIERTTKYISLLLNSMVEQKVYFDEISKWDFEMIISSARLHDIGKIVISDAILNKPGSLTEEEYKKIMTHAAEGIRIVDNIIAISDDDLYLQNIKLFVGYHHERWDGQGYPHGLKGLDIPLQGRIMAIADVYDALVSERPYKKAFPHSVAIEVMKNNSGTHFDPELVKVFLACEKEFEKLGVK
jgi:putative two-component system response regulator